MPKWSWLHPALRSRCGCTSLGNRSASSLRVNAMGTMATVPTMRHSRKVMKGPRPAEGGYPYAKPSFISYTEILPMSACGHNRRREFRHLRRHRPFRRRPIRSRRDHAFAFLHRYRLARVDVRKLVHLSAGPLDLHRISFCSLPQAKGGDQFACGKIA